MFYDFVHLSQPQRSYNKILGALDSVYQTPRVEENSSLLEFVRLLSEVRRNTPAYLMGFY